MVHRFTRNLQVCSRTGSVLHCRGSGAGSSDDQCERVGCVKAIVLGNGEIASDPAKFESTQRRT